MTMMENQIKPKVYLSGAYTSLGKEVAWQLHRASALLLISNGFIPISPVCHSLGIIMDLPEDKVEPFYLELEEPFISISDYFGVIITPESFTSDGVKREVEIARRLDKPFLYIVYNNEEFYLVCEHCSQHENFPEDKKEEIKEEVKKKCSEERLSQEAQENSIYLGKLLGKMKIG